MILTKAALEAIFGPEKVKESTYITRENRTYIRLINNKPEEASYPGLYPNIREYRKALLKYDNVPGKRLDKHNKLKKGNQKIDAEITILPTERPPLPDTEED